MPTLIKILTLILLLAAPATGAHFDINSGRVILRQLQYCTHCGSALLITGITPGTLVRCPDCGHEQPRIENQYTLNQMYQLCKTCQGPLNPEGHKPGDITECQNCRTRQPLDRDAFALAKSKNGPGYAPGHPPGTAKKTLLLAPQQPDTFLSMIPLDYSEGDLPLPPGFLNDQRNQKALPAIPQPPKEFTPPERPAPTTQAAPGHTMIITEEPRKKEPLPLREPPQQPASPPQWVSPDPGPREPRQAPAQPAAKPPIQSLDPAPEPVRPTLASTGAIDVPAVTADLFGGKETEPAAARRDKSGFVSPGRILARVNGEPIYQRDVDRVVEPIMERLRARAGKDEAELISAREQDLRKEALERLIDRELVVREAAAMGYVPNPGAIRDRENELAQIMTMPGVNLRREAMRDITMMDMRRQFEKTGSANPAAVREFYQKHKDELVQPRRIALDQLVVYEDRTDGADRRDYREIAVEIAGFLESGGKFDEARERYDEFTRRAGVEHAEPRLMVESAYSREVLRTAGELRRGAVFGPLFLPGMALFGKVVDERKEGPVPFEEVEKEIRRKLEMEATERNLGDWLKRLRMKARIEVAE